MADYELEEYKSLVQEIQKLAQEARQLEVYCAGSVAAIFAWFVSSDLSHFAAWFLPVIIPILGLIRSWALYERARRISEYIRIVESQRFDASKQAKGWETWYSKIRRHGLTPSGILFWCVLLVTCVVFPFLAAN